MPAPWPQSPLLQIFLSGVTAVASLGGAMAFQVLSAFWVTVVSLTLVVWLNTCGCLAPLSQKMQPHGVPLAVLFSRIRGTVGNLPHPAGGSVCRGWGGGVLSRGS